MEFRSVQQIDAEVIGLLPALGDCYDRVVGCSDGAMIPARLLALHLRLKLIQVDIENHFVSSEFSDGEAVLIVELAVDDAERVQHLRDTAKRLWPNSKVTILSVYTTAQAEPGLDLFGQLVPSKPYFEWNFLDREGLAHICFDIDGVLCEDPTPEQNDDGPLYQAFLESVQPLHRPACRVGWLVTSRLEKYREQTERWMAKWGIEFGELRMIDLPNKEARKAANCHGSFKAGVYASVDAQLFIESNPAQAWEIAQRTGKPVFCVDTMQMVDLNLPSPVASETFRKQSDSFMRRARSAVKRLVR